MCTSVGGGSTILAGGLSTGTDLINGAGLEIGVIPPGPYTGMHAVLCTLSPPCVSLSPCRPVTLVSCDPIALSRCHAVTLSPCHPVALSSCHDIALSPSHPLFFAFSHHDTILAGNILDVISAMPSSTAYNILVANGTSGVIMHWRGDGRVFFDQGGLAVESGGGHVIGGTSPAEYTVNGRCGGN